jgi:hypothetical protein
MKTYEKLAASRVFAGVKPDGLAPIFERGTGKPVEYQPTTGAHRISESACSADRPVASL